MGSLLSCIPQSVAEHFYSKWVLSFLTLCSLFVIFADECISVSALADPVGDLIIWIAVPVVICIFCVEYLSMRTLIFQCGVLSATSCDLVYILSILSLSVEVSRIVPSMKQFDYHSLDENQSKRHIDDAVYWEHKL